MCTYAKIVISEKIKNYTSSSLHSNLTFLLTLWAFYISLRLPPIPLGGDNFKIQLPLEECLKPLYSGVN